jgi:hypothetical protein
MENELLPSYKFVSGLSDLNHLQEELNKLHNEGYRVISMVSVKETITILMEWQELPSPLPVHR